MFKLNPKPTFKVDVTIPSPSGEGKLTLEFKHKGRKALAEFFESLRSDEEAAREDADALSELVAGWSGVDAEFNRDNLAVLLDNYPGASLAIFNAYTSALNEGRVKN